MFAKLANAKFCQEYMSILVRVVLGGLLNWGGEERQSQRARIYQNTLFRDNVPNPTA